MNIKWTKNSLENLQHIYDYISESDILAAERIIERIHERVQVLNIHPEIGHTYETADDRNIRVLLYTHYKILYWLKGKDRIDILGVVHGAMDIRRLFS